MNLNKIIEEIDALAEEKGSYVTPQEVIGSLSEKGLLNDPDFTPGKERPGSAVRKLLKNGEIPHGFQNVVGGNWKIPPLSKMSFNDLRNCLKTFLIRILEGDSLLKYFNVYPEKKTNELYIRPKEEYKLFIKGFHEKFFNDNKDSFSKHFNEGSDVLHAKEEKPPGSDLISEISNDVLSYVNNEKRILKQNYERAKVDLERFVKYVTETKVNNVKLMTTDQDEPVKKQSLNQILFGPPGTGKTYHTVNKAIEIVNPDFSFEGKRREEIKAEYKRLCEEGRVVFTTFHQSMSYEDFIEGIKPKVKGEGVVYEVEKGLFVKISNKAFSSLIGKREIQESVNIETLTFDQIYAEFLEYLKSYVGKEEYIFKTRQDCNLRIDRINSKNSLVLKFKWSDSTQTKPASEPYTITKSNLKKIFESKLVPGDIKSITSDLYPYVRHNQSQYYAVYKYFYEFVKERYGESSLKEIDTDDDFYYEEIKEKWELLEDPQDRNGGASQNYVLIIDEINRGNVSQVFGELITLLEEDKRIGRKEALEVILPYSKERFAVPPNLYIIGTMNTADRSVEALDTALRRRFSFEEMAPKPSLLQKINVSEINLQVLLEKINTRLEKLLSKDHLIGHSYLLCVKSENDLKSAFYDKIIPLLQEYFYGDWGKIGLVLGKGFVKVKQQKEQDRVFADFYEMYDSSGLEDKVLYEIVDYRNKEVDYIVDKEKMTFIRALEILIK